VSEKTERATPRRREEARSRGRVPRSPEVNSAAVLIAISAVLALFGPRLLAAYESILQEGLTNAGDPKLVRGDGLGTLVGWALRGFALTAAPIALTALVAGVLANIAQVRLRITPLALVPSLGKLNPLAGLKRIFGRDGAVETVKAAVKTSTVGLVAFLVIKPRVSALSGLVGAPPSEVLGEIGGAVRALTLWAGGAFVLIAVADYSWQRYRHEQSLRMTKSEVKQDAKQTDVPPEVKRAMRRRQAELARRRMIADVPSADVVVVNPTHYAVALRYDGTKPAPEVVAKGRGVVAAAIRRVAEEARVPIVHNAPLARTLYSQVELGRMIPEELFTAVAEVLAFVYRTAGRRSLKQRPRRPTTRRNAARGSSPRR
jgi:flagellar biosynthesis protein FlhB